MPFPVLVRPRLGGSSPTAGGLRNFKRAHLALNRRCLVEVPNAPRHRAERAHAEADYDEETAFDNYCSPEAGHRAGPGGPINA